MFKKKFGNVKQDPYLFLPRSSLVEVYPKICLDERITF